MYPLTSFTTMARSPRGRRPSTIKSQRPTLRRHHVARMLDFEALENRQLLSTGDIKHLTASPGPHVRPIAEIALVHPRALRPSALTALVQSGPDANGNVTISGKAAKNTTVKLDINDDGSIEKTTKSDSRGRYNFSIQVELGTSPLRVSARKNDRATLTVARLDTTPPTL